MQDGTSLKMMCVLECVPGTSTPCVCLSMTVCLSGAQNCGAVIAFGHAHYEAAWQLCMCVNWLAYSSEAAKQQSGQTSVGARRSDAQQQRYVRW